MDTAELIGRLSATATPVHVLRSPLVRAAGWLLIASAIVGLVAVEHGFRADILTQLAKRPFLLGACASFSTGVSAALACLLASLPDRSRRWLLLPLPSLGIWMGTLGYGCLTDWVSYDAGGVRFGGAFRCLATVLILSLPLSAAIFVMVRHVVRLRPALVTMTAGLAVAGVTSTAMSLVYRLDATVMNLSLNLKMTAVIVALEAAVGRRVLSGMVQGDL